jgi:hypothetical protein
VFALPLLHSPAPQDDLLAQRIVGALLILAALAIGTYYTAWVALTVRKDLILIPAIISGFALTHCALSAV